MNKKVPIIIAIVCVTILVTVSVLLFVFRDKNEDYLTRAEWITMLAENFGLTTYEQEEPYYTDIPETHEVYAYVQACYEWGILRESETFRPEQVATREFVAETAMLTTMLDYDKSFANMSAAELLQYAFNEGIVLSTIGSDKMTGDECAVVVERITAYYLSLKHEDYVNVKLKENVIDFTSATNPVTAVSKVSPSSEFVIEEDTVYLPLEIGQDISVGTVFIIPGDAYGVAKKAVSVDIVDGQVVIKTTAPEVEEVFEELEFHHTATPSFEDITPLQDGISLELQSTIKPTSSSSEKKRIGGMSSVEPIASGSKKDPISFDVKVNLTNGTLTPSVAFTEYFSAEASQQYKNFFGNELPEEAGTILKQTNTVLKYDKDNKLTAIKQEKWDFGYEITGTLGISNMYIEVLYADGGKKFSGEVNFDAECSLTYKGKIEGEVPVFKTVLPIVPGVCCEVNVYIYVDVNGELSVGAKLSHCSRVTYENKKYKTAQKTGFEAEVAAAIEIEAGIKGELVPMALGIELVDISAKAGAGAEISAKVNSSDTDAMICIEAKAYYPTVSISVGMKEETVVHKLGIKANFNLVDKSKAPIKSATLILFHYEFTDQGARNVKACTWGVEKNPSKPEGGQGAAGGGGGGSMGGRDENDKAPKPTTTNPGSPDDTTDGELLITTHDGYCSVDGIGTWTSEELIIPESYNGIPVTHISDGAFDTCTSFSSVYIPDSITYIGERAFADCGSLAGISIPDSVTIIEDVAFAGCDSLMWVDIPYSVTHIGDASFYHCSSLATVTIPDSVTFVGEQAFAECDALRDVYVGEAVAYIGDYAFYDCPLLSDVNFGTNSQLLAISKSSFEKCTNLTNINLPGKLVTIEDNAFHSCTNLANVTINGAPSNIGAGAFAGCESLTSFTIPDMVTVIKDSVFADCINLRTVNIPQSVTVIQAYAFMNCDSLEAVYYAGSQPGWDNIDIAWYVTETSTDGSAVACNPALQNATIYYNTDTTPPTDDPAQPPVTPIMNAESIKVHLDALTWLGMFDSVASISNSDLFFTMLMEIKDYEQVPIGGEDEWSTYYKYTYSIPVLNDWTQRVFGTTFDFSHVKNSGFDGVDVTYDATNDTLVFTEQYYWRGGGPYPWYEYINHTVDGNEYIVLCQYNTEDIQGNAQLTFVESEYGFAIVSAQSLPSTPTEDEYSDLIFEFSDNSSSFVVTGVTSQDITTVTIPSMYDGIPVTSIGAYAFSGCANLTEVIIENGIISIESNAFADCTSLTSISLPDSVTVISNYAFVRCSALKNVNLGSGVTDLGMKAFYFCTALEGIWVNEDNQTFSSDERGVLFNKNKTVLILAPLAIEGPYTVPSGVIQIGNGAFWHCIYLTDLIISDGVESIGESAIRDCKALKSITIPSSVENIDANALFWCSSLTSIQYNGTTEQWYMINKGNNWKGQVPANEVICIDGIINF